MRKKEKKVVNPIKIKKRLKAVYISVRLVLVLALIFISLKVPLVAFLALILAVIGVAVSFASGVSLQKRASGNGIIYGQRGAGKGLILNYLIRTDKTKPYCNIPYANSELLPSLDHYLNSIKPLTTEHFIKGGFPAIKKLDQYEGRNVYIDDINVFMPNWEDAVLKKMYPSMPPMLAINRHLYNAKCVITTQDRERPYKILKELQGDFSIKAIKTRGWGFIWECLPILHYFVYTKYIWHELPKSADMLPFASIGASNKVLSPVVLSAGQATKDVYEATNGAIEYGFVLQLKKNIKYDTRYFHKVVFGYEADAMP